MFPKTFGTVLMIIGAIWMVQGFGVADTGSFMDGKPLWAALGAGFFVTGLVSTLLRRRKTRDADQPGS